MPAPTKPVPKIAIQGIAGGLLLMSFFTMMWAIIAASGTVGTAKYVIMAVFGGFCIIFIINSIRFFIAAKHFPPLTAAEDKARGKKIGMWYGIIFGAEGVTIPLVVFTLLHFGQGALIVPAIALVVGLHFYPMAKVFNRSIDYYLATWTCLVAIAAIIITMNNLMPQQTVFAFLGVGVALATSGYGLYMIYEGKRLRKV